MGSGKKKSQEKGWPIVFIDESGYMLQPLVRRTWAPKGETPILQSWSRHGRWSVIAGIGFSPVRGLPRLFFQIHPKNIRSEQVKEFLQTLHRHLGRKFILILDRYSAHRKAVRLLQEAHPDWIEVVWLPAYAPELNPVEMVWNHTKYGDLANFIPADLDDLKQAIKVSLEQTRSEFSLLMACFRQTGLEW